MNIDENIDSEGFKAPAPKEKNLEDMFQNMEITMVGK